MNHAARVAIGTAVLTRRALGGSWQSVALRGGAAAYVSPYLFAELQPYPYIAPAGLVGWLGAAWWAGRPQTVPEREEPPPAGAEEATEPPRPDDLVPAVQALAAGGHGAHLAALAEHLTESTGHPWNTAAVRAACDALKIPVTGSVRQPGRGVSTGVRLADLPDPSSDPSPDPAVAVVVAGQETPTGATTAPATPVELQLAVEEGAGITIIRDPAERRAYKV
ncbi:hypothetical protein [Streptomyces sp. NBC_01233]|uniref:hypothetical protein n=1 Tax=Streptomyces sp. NBC_01233 TaxID=2903787 RepID=UPI002E0F7B32|nr:hypothetical protein OG332_10650 [Streptomyces sp. NBC_01233]